MDLLACDDYSKYLKTCHTTTLTKATAGDLDIGMFLFAEGDIRTPNLSPDCRSETTGNWTSVMQVDIRQRPDTKPAPQDRFCKTRQNTHQISHCCTPRTVHFHHQHLLHHSLLDRRHGV